MDAVRFGILQPGQHVVKWDRGPVLCQRGLGVEAVRFIELMSISCTWGQNQREERTAPRRKSGCFFLHRAVEMHQI